MFLSYFIVQMKYEIWHKLKVVPYIIIFWAYIHAAIEDAKRYKNFKNIIFSFSTQLLQRKKIRIEYLIYKSPCYGKSINILFTNNNNKGFRELRVNKVVRRNVRSDKRE